MKIYVNLQREEKIKLVDIQQRGCPFVSDSEKWTFDDLFQIANKTEEGTTHWKFCALVLTQNEIKQCQLSQTIRYVLRY
jgi:hypothetical protein